MLKRVHSYLVLKPQKIEPISLKKPVKLANSRLSHMSTKIASIYSTNILALGG